MLERLGRSWSLIKGSVAIVRDNKLLLVLPVLAGLAMLAITPIRTLIAISGVVVLLATIVLHSALHGVYSAVLYCYATLGGEGVPTTMADALGGAFTHRGRRRAS